MAGNTQSARSRLGAGGKQAPSRVALVSALFRFAGKSAVSFKTGSRYAVRRDGDKLLLDVTRKGGAKRTLKPSDAEFLTVAPDAVEAFSGGSRTASTSSSTASSGTASTTTSTSTATTSSSTASAPSTDTSASSGAAPASSAPEWTKKLYVAEILALDGWSNGTYSVKAGTLDHLPAPTITVTSIGRDLTTFQYGPHDDAWETTAKNVLDAKAAADGGASSSTSGTFVPSSESATPSGAPSAPSDAATVSSTPTTPAPAAPGFVEQYKWWLVGGAAAALGYVLLHRAKPDTFPLPASVSKWVR